MTKFSFALVAASFSVLFLSSNTFAQSGVGGQNLSGLGVGAYAQAQWSLAMARNEAVLRTAALKARTHELAKQSLTCKTQQDCVQVPMGARACGGPATYVITSKQNPSLQEFIATAQEATNAELAVNNIDGIYGICISELVPEFDCDAGLCQAIAPTATWGIPL